jgi:acetyl esterase/lipase
MSSRPKVRGFGLVSVLVLGLFAVSIRAADAPDDVNFQRDVVYGKGGGVDLKLNLSRPKNPTAKKLPCVVVIHGGGWAGGDRTNHDDLTWQFARQGYVSATVGYRLAPKHRFPAQVNDVKCAVRFLRAHADEYGIDPDHFGAIGFSAGGHLSMMLGLTDKKDGLEGDGGSPDQSSKVQAVVSFFGPTNLLAEDIPQQVLGILDQFIGGTKSEKQDEYRKASPITYVTPDDAPMLLFQGTKDPLVPHTQTYPMLEAMTKNGIPGRIELLIGASHGWGDPELRRTAVSSFAFFDDHLKAKPGTAKAPEKPANAPAGRG